MSTAKLGLVAVAGMILSLAGVCIAQDDDPVVDEKPLSQILKNLQSENRGIQMRAAQSLSKASSNDYAKIAPKLMPLLRSERENDRFVAAQALGNYGTVSKAAVPDLLVMLEGTQYERNRAAAAKALGQILKDSPPSDEIEKVTKKLITIFRDKYPDVQREAVGACGMIGPAAKSAIPHMKEPLVFTLGNVAADSPYLMVRQATAWALGRMGPLSAEYIDLLVSKMHGEGRNAPEVAEAIGLIGPLNDNVAANIVDHLERYGRDWRHSPASQMAAWKALERFGPKAAPAVPLIVRYLKMGRGDSEPPELIIEWFKILRSIGAPAKDALPQVQKYTDAKTIPNGWTQKTDEIAKEAVKTVEALGGK